MEIYSKTTRFALACNASDKIIGEWAAWATSSSKAPFVCIYFFHLSLGLIVSVCLNMHALELVLQAVVSHLVQVLGTKLGFSVSSALHSVCARVCARARVHKDSVVSYQELNLGRCPYLPSHLAGPVLSLMVLQMQPRDFRHAPY